MLTLVPERRELVDARDLIFLAETTRTVTWLLCGLLVSAVGASLMLAGAPELGGLLVGAAISLALSCYGPRWWPGRR